MADLIVKIYEVSEVVPHLGADRLEILRMDGNGWETIVPKGQYKPGDLVVFVPTDCVVPQVVSDELGITQHLGKNGRVRAAKLRKVTSYGFVFSFGSTSWCEGPAEIGRDVALLYGITRYEPPQRLFSGDMEREHPLFSKYTKIENYQNYPDMFEVGEEVVVEEKIHGSSSRVGYVSSHTEEGDQFSYVVGSHNTQRKIQEEEPSLYQLPLEATKGMLEALQRNFPYAKSFIIFGEIYGFKIQDLQYGETEAKFRAFDILIDDIFLDYDEFSEWCGRYEIPMVPLLYHGPFDVDAIKEIVEQDTALMEDNSHMSEGVVIKPIRERVVANERVILKWESDRYSLRQGGTENK